MSVQLPFYSERDPASQDSTNRDRSSDRPTKVRRIRLACRRCQTRKIKCDGAVPKCTACRRAEADCIDGKTTIQEGAISRSEAATLYDQIQRLEEALRLKCPDLNVADVMSGQLDLSSLTQAGSSNQAVEFTSSSQISQNRVPLSNIRSSEQNLTSENNGIRQAQVRPPDSQEVAHEIGLIPLSAGISKYVGPSSGLTFAKLLFARADQAGLSPESSHGASGRVSHESPSTVRSRSSFTILPSALPNTVNEAIQLSKIYFEHVHAQYPFLHEPSHYRLLHKVYQDNVGMPKAALFQVNMVLAVSAVILSKRLRIPFTGEGLCEAAMKHVNEIDFQNSTQGLQCLLLVSMFTLHSSYLGISPWYLNYQCLAAVLDLGLQRDVPLSPSVTEFEKEIRTRMFWVIYSLDRTLATTLGRPIGLRDEACELRLPTEKEDQDLGPASELVFDDTDMPSWPGPIACSIMLFKLAQLNSEIKYILHSVTRNTPNYTYPQITDIKAWQVDLWQRLQKLHDETPSFRAGEKYLLALCQIRYHEIIMLLFRPTPRIRAPVKESLLKCHTSAQATIQLWKELYETDRMSYSWITIHSVCLSTITLLYCIWMVPEIAASTKIDVLTNTMRDSSNLLSAAGEHWPEARRSRNSLDDLTTATVRWLLDTRSNRRSHGERGDREQTQAALSSVSPSTISVPKANTQSDTYDSSHQGFNFGADLDFMGFDSYIDFEDFAVFIGAPDPFTDSFSNTMEGMFSEYQPLFDFNP